MTTSATTNLTLAILTALTCVLLPAAASAWRPAGPETYLTQDLNSLAQQVADAERRGELTDWEKVWIERQMEAAWTALDRAESDYNVTPEEVISVQEATTAAAQSIRKLTTNTYRAGSQSAPRVQ